MPFNFNWQVHKLTINLIKEYKPYILHFIGENKPWKLNNYLTKNYYQPYLDFFNNSYKGIHIEVLTTDEQRLKSPKYSNKLREVISRKAQQLKQHMALKNGQLSTSELKTVKDALSTKDFGQNF